MIDGDSDFWCKFDIKKPYQNMNISLIKGKKSLLIGCTPNNNKICVYIFYYNI